MHPKKNYNKDLNNKRTLYFVLGLLLLLFAVYSALEWKTKDNTEGYDIEVIKHESETKKDSTVILNTKVKK